MRLIDKDATIELIEGNICEIISESGRDLNGHTNRTLRRIAKTIEEMQTFEERKTGEWIPVGKSRGLIPSDDFKCSVCGNFLDFQGVNVGRGDANYCPNCGAKMEGADE